MRLSAALLLAAAVPALAEDAPGKAMPPSVLQIYRDALDLASSGPARSFGAPEGHEAALVMGTAESIEIYDPTQKWEAGKGRRLLAAKNPACRFVRRLKRKDGRSLDEEYLDAGCDGRNVKLRTSAQSRAPRAASESQYQSRLRDGYRAILGNQIVGGFGKWKAAESIKSSGFAGLAGGDPQRMKRALRTFGDMYRRYWGAETFRLWLFEQDKGKDGAGLSEFYGEAKSQRKSRLGGIDTR